MPLTYKKVEQTPLQSAITTYKFLVADLQEGLNYRVSEEVYNNAMEAVKSSLRVNESVKNQKFCKDFNTEYMKAKNAGLL